MSIAATINHLIRDNLTVEDGGTTETLKATVISDERGTLVEVRRHDQLVPVGECFIEIWEGKLRIHVWNEEQVMSDATVIDLYKMSQRKETK